MPVKPKIYTKEDVDRLTKAYIEEKMSTVDIENNSEEIFGQFISRGTIYKELVRHDIKVRNKSISVSRAMSTLNIDQSFETEEIIEWIDGLMLGDGFINFKKENFSNSRYVIGTSSKQWAEYAMSKLKDYDPCEPMVYQKVNKKHPNPIWEIKTKTHPDIVNQTKRWYSGENQSKVVPSDIRITPISVMLWYLGDGSFHYIKKNNAPQLRLATCSFSEDEINLLREKLEEEKIRTTIYRSKMDIHVCSESIKHFFNFIGWKSPFSDYDHKFDIPEWLKLCRLSEIIDNDRDKWRIQKLCKEGKIDCSRSPGRNYFLFDRNQEVKLRSMLA